MKILILALMLLAACSKRKIDDQSLEHSDDFVLIEFASKLEEDYHKIEQIQKKSR